MNGNSSERKARALEDYYVKLARFNDEAAFRQAGDSDPDIQHIIDGSLRQDTGTLSIAELRKYDL